MWAGVRASIMDRVGLGAGQKPSQLHRRRHHPLRSVASMAGQPLPGRLAHLVGVEAEVVEEGTGRLVAGKAYEQVGHIDVFSTRAIGVFESGVA